MIEPILLPLPPEEEECPHDCDDDGMMWDDGSPKIPCPIHGRQVR